LSVPTHAEETGILLRHGRTERPLGDADFVAHLEAGAESASGARKTGGETGWEQPDMSVVCQEFRYQSIRATQSGFRVSESAIISRTAL